MLKLKILSDFDLDRAAAIVVADLHLHNLPGWRFKWCEEFAEELLSISGESPKVELVLLGDVFEVRDRVPAVVANLFFRLVSRWRSLVWWVVGQHDSWRPGIATYHELGSFSDRLIVVQDQVAMGAMDLSKKRTSLEGWWILPYVRDLAVYKEQLARVPGGSSLLTHIPLKEAIPGNPDQLISLKEFARFGMVVAGDVHTGRTFNKNFHYVGTPAQRDWRDFGAQGTLGLITGDRRKWSFRRMAVNSVQHKKLLGSRATERFLEDCQNGSNRRYIVKLVGVDETNPLVDRVRECGCVERLEVEFERPMESQFDGIVNQSLLGPEELLLKYIEQNDPGSIDKDFLLQVGKELLSQDLKVEIP